MKVEIINGIGPEPVVLEATRVLITRDDGTPVAVASEWMPGVITCGHAGEAGFAMLLKSLGIDRTVVVEKLRPPRFEDIQV